MTRENLRLRDAQMADCEKVFAWRNDPRLIAVSSSGETVDWETHQAWFSRKVRDPKEIFLVIEACDGEAIGVIRLDSKSRGVRTINIYLDPDRSGKGLGPRALEMAVEAAYTRDSALRTIEAVVGVDNRRSRSMFEALGFQTSGKQVETGFLEYRFIHKP